jgi:ribosomal protein L22
MVDFKKALAEHRAKQGEAMLEQSTVMTVEQAISYLTLLKEKKEPVFILRGQDRLAVPTVFYWAQLAEKSGVDIKKVSGAWRHAEAMAAWPKRKLPD